MDAIDVIKTKYVRELLANGKREDGRSINDFRSIRIANDIVSSAEGSAQVDLGSTRVLVGVKLEIDTPMEDNPEEGNLTVSSELLPLASADYEPGPPSPEAIELARVVDRGIRAGSCVDMKSLFIEEGKAWFVYADIYVLNYDGNLIDASTMAVMSALMHTRVPKYEDGKIIREESSGKLKIDNIVTSATFGKIDGHLLLDTTKNEENAADARLTIATDDNYVRAMQKGLSGSLSTNDVIELAGLAFEKHKEIKGYLKE
ncbi:MAG: RNA-binding protein [Candidatus Marsarchaeota archaeon]|jgi:exosome complex component RRP42|nr:RNA-binding protein [Candidatus Marsarchaeota archaeon]MCL5418677.1 RNA-binding protein [Candidatus Marsarchaeota archaeon]